MCLTALYIFFLTSLRIRVKLHTMRERTYLLFVFLFCLCAVGAILLISKFGWLSFVENSIQEVFFPLNALVYEHSMPSSSSQLSKLQQENAALLAQLQSLNQLQADNTALRDQFQTTTLPTKNLLPVQVVGMPGVIPNITFPETLIVNAGNSEGIHNGQAVVVKNELIGFVTQISSHFSVVTLVSNPSSSFSVRTSGTGAIGIVKGQGNGQMIIANVLLSDSLKINDTVVTMGNQDISGNGLPPNVLIGKVVSVEKNPSSLFQQADIIPLV